jgi:quercetin dioxygenase-like cupin family protein
MKTLMKILIALCFAASSAVADDAKVTSLMQHSLAAMNGQEGTLIRVEYEPGGSSDAHRHNAYAFVYVLNGSLVMQVEGEEAITLGPGETFFESPQHVHTVSRNASTTMPVSFLVFFVKQKDAPISVPAGTSPKDSQARSGKSDQ